jgi:hypothetical protein
VGGLRASLGVTPGQRAIQIEETVTMLNDHFVQSEVEYQRQQRLAAAAEYRRARSAARVRSLRDRLAAAVEQVTTIRRHHGQPRHATTGEQTARAT